MSHVCHTPFSTVPSYWGWNVNVVNPSSPVLRSWYPANRRSACCWRERRPGESRVRSAEAGPRGRQRIPARRARRHGERERPIRHLRRIQFQAAATEWWGRRSFDESDSRRVRRVGVDRPPHARGYLDEPAERVDDHGRRARQCEKGDCRRAVAAAPELNIMANSFVAHSRKP